MEHKEFLDANGNISATWTEKNGKIHGEWKLYFENGEIRKKCQYENNVCVFLEEYHLNGTMVRKGSFKDGKEYGDWEYYNAKNGKKINKKEYESKWYKNLPKKFKDFVCFDDMSINVIESGVDGVYKDQNTGEIIKNVVEEYYQICENFVILYKDGEEVDSGYLELTLFSNIAVWDSGVCQGYDRQEEDSFVMSDVDYDDIHLETERELDRYCDIGYAEDQFDRGRNNWLEANSVK